MRYWLVIETEHQGIALIEILDKYLDLRLAHFPSEEIIFAAELVPA